MIMIIIIIINIIIFRDRGERNLHSLESDVSEVTTLLRNNVEKVIARGEKIDDLQDRSRERERNVLFNDALNTFYLRCQTYG